MNECDLCHAPTRNRRRTAKGELLCTEHRDYAEWFDSLTPEEQRAELAMIYAGFEDDDSET
jgi:hypothetical protein